MKKNFVKVVLLGAFAFSTTVSFIGCKDYDDDIDGVKESITATNSDLSAKATALEASIASLKSAQMDVTAAIAKATDSAEKAALKAKNDAIASSLVEMTKIQKDITDLINSNNSKTTSDITTLNEKAKSIDNRLVSVEGGLSEIQKALRDNAGAFAETVGKLQSAMTRIDQLEANVPADLKQTLQDIAGQIKALETQSKAIDYLKADNITNTKALQEAQTKIAELLSTLETQKAALDKAATKDDLKKVQDQVDANKMLIEGLSASIGKINARINTLSSFFLSMITSINLVSESIIENNLTAIKCLNNHTFGEGLNGAIEFKKDQIYTMSGEPIIIQVSPSTANLKVETLSIIRSDGESLDQYLTTTVDAYNDAITTKSESKGGLWKITTQLKKDYNKDDFKKLTVKEDTGKPYLFAIAAKKSNEEIQQEARTVVSPYKLTFSDEGSSTLSDIVATTVNGSTRNYVPVEINKPFIIKVKGNTGAKIYACYATFRGSDYEKVVWRSYGITGYDVVKTGEELSLNVANETANDNIVSITVNAIDFTGNNVASKIINIICGKKNSATPSFTATVSPEVSLPTSFYSMPKAVGMSANLATTDADAVNLLSTTPTVSINGMSNVGVEFYKKDLSGPITTSASVSDIKNIAAIKLTNIDLTKIPDNGSVTGDIVFKKWSGLQVLNVPITLNKTMPAFPSAFSAKTGMLNNGIITVYPEFTPNSSKATFKYTKIFNMITDLNSSYFNFASINNLGAKIDFTDSKMIQVDNSLVGKESSIDMTVSYNYGMISSVEANNYYWKPTWGTAFAIKFASIPKESAISLKEDFTIKYPAPTKTLATDEYIITRANDKNTADMKLEIGKNQIRSIDLKTISGAKNNIINEYYTPKLESDGSITFTKKSDNAVVNENVPSTLIITIKDEFGNTFDKKIDFTILKQ